MTLTRYKQKRTFGTTPEPAGGKATGTRLRFVVQKHQASHLHYDFRLEMDGVLKSWAVPKGPSMDTAVKRLAMMVEDHPYDYRTFEGTIPEGNYGAGTVIVWDEGYYKPAEGTFKTKAEADKALRHQLYGGRLKFILQGKKLKGEFALVRAKGRGENAWLLMKLADDYATHEDILGHDKSVASGKTVEELAAGKPTKGKPVKKKASAPKKKTIEKVARATHPEKVKRPTPRAGKKKARPVDDLIGSAPREAFDPRLKPMLATLVDKPFDEPGWLYEIKWDGYRALACMNKGEVMLKSRNDKSFNDKFYPVYRALLDWNMNAIVDGEIIVLKESGVSDFGALQNWRSEADGDLMYYVFDILWLDGHNLCGLPLSARREILKSIVPAAGMIRLSDAFDATGTEFFQAAQSMGLEGIIAKKAEGEYIPGERTLQWLKIKANKRQEVVIGGFTNNEGSSKPFSSLLVGVFQGKELIYTGKIGTGFNQKLQREMIEQFKPLIIDRAPFAEEPDYNKPSRFNPRPAKATATWLKPVLVCEVSFAEMTSDGVMRHPSFEGMRADKKAAEVVREKPRPVQQAVRQADQEENESIVRPAAKRARNTLLNPTDETQVREIAGHTLKFNNLSKVYWPGDGVTKRDMLNYYYQVAPFILPYLKDRPQSLNRFPNGIHGKSFYQKDVTGKVPDWVTTYQYHSSDALDVDKHFLVPQSEADILLMASMGCIELNPWSSRIDKPDHPDWCIIDLDPGPTNTFKQVIEAALVTRQVLDSVGIPSYCKTSGSTGLHIYIPLGAKYTYEQSKEFARVIATHVHREIPRYTSIERLVGNRGGRMYLDFLQNRPKATLAAPYSLRPKPGATVSTPLLWEEVTPKLKMKDFTIHNVVQRLREVGDLFKPVLGKGIQLSAVEKIDD